jgi:hypothetical protein
MHASGSADVDVFPLLELYARVASLAGRTDIVGPSGGLRAFYNLNSGNPLAELPKPSELVERADRSLMEGAAVSKRDHYRELLQDAMYTAIRNGANAKETMSKKNSSRALSRNASLNGGASFEPLIRD